MILAFSLPLQDELVPSGIIAIAVHGAPLHSFVASIGTTLPTIAIVPHARHCTPRTLACLNHYTYISMPGLAPEDGVRGFRGVPILVIPWA